MINLGTTYLSRRTLNASPVCCPFTMLVPSLLAPTSEQKYFKMALSGTRKAAATSVKLVTLVLTPFKRLSCLSFIAGMVYLEGR